MNNVKAYTTLSPQNSLGKLKSYGVLTVRNIVQYIDKFDGRSVLIGEVTTGGSKKLVTVHDAYKVGSDGKVVYYASVIPERVVESVLGGLVAHGDDVEPIEEDEPEDQRGFYVVRSRVSNKFADGHFGWDSNIHSDCQIFSKQDLPYSENDDMEFIFVGDTRPSIDVVDMLIDVYY